MSATVASLSKSGEHTFSKKTAYWLDLIAGEGVLGDAHCDIKVKHRSRVALDPRSPTCGNYT